MIASVAILKFLSTLSVNPEVRRQKRVEPRLHRMRGAIPCREAGAVGKGRARRPHQRCPVPQALRDLGAKYTNRGFLAHGTTPRRLCAARSAARVLAKSNVAANAGKVLPCAGRGPAYTLSPSPLSARESPLLNVDRPWPCRVTNPGIMRWLDELQFAVGFDSRDFPTSRNLNNFQYIERYSGAP